MKKKLRTLFIWAKAFLFVMVGLFPWNFASAQNLIFLGAHEGQTDGSFYCVGEDTYCVVVVTPGTGPDIRIDNSVANFNAAIDNQFGNSITVNELNTDGTLYRSTSGVLSGFTATDLGDSTTSCSLTWSSH